MTKEELLTALRAAPGPSRELDAEIAALMGYVFVRGSNGNKLYLRPGQDPNEAQITGYLQDRLPMFTNSLDAAAAFRERMLPGWGVTIIWDSHEKSVSLYAEDGSGDDYGRFAMTETCATECLSICAAVVAGVIAQENGK
jgi:hypothetical protein